MKKANVHFQDFMIRKSDLDDYRSDRFERMVLELSTILMRLELDELRRNGQYHRDDRDAEDDMAATTNKENIKLPKDLENKLLKVNHELFNHLICPFVCMI